MTNVLILGAGGFIGRHLAEALSRRVDVTVTGFGRTRPPDFDRCEFVSGEIEDTAGLKALLHGQHAVYHFISQTIPASSWESPLCEVEKNLVPTIRLIEAAADAGIEKFYFASSGGTVYGLNDDVVGELHPTDPFAPYGIIKRAIESFLLYANVQKGLNYEIYRISNVYGEGQETAKGLGFINTALENIVAGRETTIYGDGENIRDYIYVGDLVKILQSRLSAGFDASDTFNISSNRPVTLNKLVDIIRRVTGADFPLRRVSSRVNDNRTVQIENKKILAACPEVSLMPLEEGILKTYEALVSRYAHAN